MNKLQIVDKHKKIPPFTLDFRELAGLLPFGGGFAFVYNPQDGDANEGLGQTGDAARLPIVQSDRYGDDVEANHGDAKMNGPTVVRSGRGDGRAE